MSVFFLNKEEDNLIAFQVKINEAKRGDFIEELILVVSEEISALSLRKGR